MLWDLGQFLYSLHHSRCSSLKMHRGIYTIREHKPMKGNNRIKQGIKINKKVHFYLSLPQIDKKFGLGLF